MLISLGVKDGDIWKANMSQLMDYRNMVLEKAVKKSTDFGPRTPEAQAVKSMMSLYGKLATIKSWSLSSTFSNKLD